MDWVAEADHLDEARATPNLALEGFAGPLDFLLQMARANKINLAALQIQDIVEQLAQAIVQAPARMPLSQKADWVVMASWILLLRSNLMLPKQPAQQEAQIAAGELRDRLLALQEVQVLAGWLRQRPQLGRDVFARGTPDALAPSASPGGVDVVAFLWAAMALFEDPAETAETESLYQPRSLPPYALSEARARILQRLATGEVQTLEQLLPVDDNQEPPISARQAARRKRSAWSSTFIASLELAKQGEVQLHQEGLWLPVQVEAA